MFARLVRDSMVLRLGDAERDRLLARPGARPFVAMGRRMRQWVVVPPALIESRSGLRTWLGKALAHGRSAGEGGRGRPGDARDVVLLRAGAWCRFSPRPRRGRGDTAITDILMAFACIPLAIFVLALAPNLGGGALHDVLDPPWTPSG